ncbi:MAG: Maf family protein [Planctomycetaceae bacterium]|jgi:septum formation protein|nr:Maf family protein [Planctomycetaceae bacterium]
MSSDSEPPVFPLILASGSPRRRQLLAEAGLSFEVMRPDADAEDGHLPDERSENYVRRLALQKGKNVAGKVGNGIILSCDTIVLGRNALAEEVTQWNILEKPADRDDARNMLRQLSGQIHFVLSGICLIKREQGQTAKTMLQTEWTELVMERISAQQIETYLDTGQWKGKAGGFGYQDGNHWIQIRSGSESNVVGLPMELFLQMYRQLTDY